MSGRPKIPFVVPTGLAGLSIGFQAAIFNSVNLVGISNAVEISFM